MSTRDNSMKPRFEFQPTAMIRKPPWGVSTRSAKPSRPTTETRPREVTEASHFSLVGTTIRTSMRSATGSERLKIFAASTACLISDAEAVLRKICGRLMMKISLVR